MPARARFHARQKRFTIYGGLWYNDWRAGALRRRAGRQLPQGKTPTIVLSTIETEQRMRQLTGIAGPGDAGRQVKYFVRGDMGVSYHQFAALKAREAKK